MVACTRPMDEEALVKKKTILLFAVLSGLTAGAAQAQDPGAATETSTARRGRLGAGVALGLPLGDFGDLAVFSVGGLLDFDWVLSPALSATGRAGYIYHVLDSDLEDFSLSTVPIWVGVKYYLGSAEASTRLFGMGELGLNYTMAEVSGFSDSEVNLGLNVGVGIELGAVSIRGFLALFDIGDAGESLSLMASASYYFLSF